MLKGLDSFAGNEVLDKVISQREIMQACENLKNGKSCGMDGILNEMISLLSILFSLKNITSLLLRILLNNLLRQLLIVIPL
jgi:hypothetical protein